MDAGGGGAACASAERHRGRAARVGTERFEDRSLPVLENGADVAADEAGVGLAVLFLAFGMSSLIKIAQGSSTVAMITTAGMLAALVQDAQLPFNLVYVGTAISAGSLVGTWMNDSGFWVFSKMGGVPEKQTLLTWTPVAALVGMTAMVMTVILSLLLPLT